jgi:hypothetical protein
MLYQTTIRSAASAAILENLKRTWNEAWWRA